MTSQSPVKSVVLFICIVAFVFSGCAMSREQLRQTDLYDMCMERYQIDHYPGSTDTSIENKNNIDAELKERNKDCGCYYQAWSPSHLYMGLLGLGLMAGSSGHCENDNPTEVKEITPAPSE